MMSASTDNKIATASSATIVAVLSDTHGYLPQSVQEALESREPDLIVHAGDSENEQTLWELEQLAPVMAVRGNCDWLPSIQKLPHVLKRKLGDFLIVVSHKPDSLSAALHKLKPQEVSEMAVVGIHGHTHVPRFEQLEPKKWILCPGSPVEPRGDSYPSIAIVTLEGFKPPQVEFIKL